MSLRAILLLAPFCLAGCEMSYFAADIQAQEVCILDMAVAFPAVPAEAGMSELTTTLETSVGQEDLGIPLSDDLQISTAVRSVLLRPHTGVVDLAFVKELDVKVGDQERALPDTLVVEIREGDRLSSGDLYAEPDNAVDVSAHIRAGELLVDLDLRGQLPEVGWEANIDLCMAVGATYVAPL